MALHITRAAHELIQFRLRDTNEIVRVESRFIWWMKKLVKRGEANAITQTQALKLMGIPNTDYHRRQWRHAADFWQEEGIAVSATTRGYFIIETEEERRRCAAFKQVTADAIERRKQRILHIPLGKEFP